MPKFSVKKSESKTIELATFHKESDFTPIYLIDKKKGEPEKKVRLIHKIQANKLIAQKKAVLAKSVEVKEKEDVKVTTKKVDKKK